MDQQRLRDCGAHRQPRIERLVRVLVDDLHPAAQRPQRALAERRQLVALEGDPAAHGLDQAQHGLGRGRLAAARFADEREQLAVLEREGDAVDRVDGLARPPPDRADEAPRDRVLDRQVLDLEQAHAVTASTSLR